MIASGAGVDYNLTYYVKIRAADFEYWEWSQFIFGNVNPYGVSVGISYHFLNGVR